MTVFKAACHNISLNVNVQVDKVKVSAKDVNETCVREPPAARPYLLLPTILLASQALRELTKKSTNQSVQWTGDGQHNDVRETPHSYQGNTSYIMRSNSNSKASMSIFHPHSP